MAIELITDSKRVQKEIGLNLEENTLQSGIFLEGSRDRLPLLVKDGNQYTLFVRRIEIGNYIENGRGAKVIKQKGIELAVYDSYFTMSDIGAEYKVYSSEADAICGTLHASEGIAYDDMPYARYLRINHTLPLQLACNVDLQKHFFIYEVDRNYVAETFTKVEPAEIQLAMKIMKERSHVSEEDQNTLLSVMNCGRIDPFDLLDPMLSEIGIRCLFVNTKLSIHTITAIPWDEIHEGEMYAYYDQEKILLFSTLPLQYPFLKKAGEISGISSIMDTIIQHQLIGIEDKSLPVGYVKTIGEEQCVGVSALLTRWRDRHAYQFLPYYIINGIGNTYAIESAIHFAQNAVANNRSITERDVDDQYAFALSEFTRLYHMEGFQLKKYFSGIQVGNRCPFAALSSDYPLTKEMHTLKIDCGAQLFKNGILLSGSDQCRSWCLTEATEKVYKILSENARKIVIPQIHSGMEGAEAYWIGIHALAQYEPLLKEMGMLEASFSLENGYNRNIGHTFSKAESTTITLDQQNHDLFEANMIGCVEYHWPYKDQSFGVEDMFFVTPTRAINFTY